MNSYFKNLLISQFVANLVSGFLAIALPLYLLEHGLDLSGIGYVFGIATLFYAFLSFWLGARSEHRGRLNTGVAATCVIIASLALFGMLPLFPLAIAIVVFTISKVLFDSSGMILWTIVKIRILDLFHHRRFGSAFGLFSLVFGIGSGVGMLIGGVLSSSLPLQTIFFGLSSLMVVSLLAYAKTGDISPKPEKGRTTHVQSLLKASRLLKSVLLMNTLLYAGATLVSSLGLPLFQKEVLGMANSQIFILMGAGSLVYGIISQLGGRLYDRYRNKIFVIALMLLAANAIVLAFVKDVPTFSAILLLDYALFGFADPARYALGGIASKEKKGVYMSFLTLFPLMAVGVAMLFFGDFVRLLSFQSIFIFRAVMQIAGIGVIIYANRLMKPLQKHEKKIGSVPLS